MASKLVLIIVFIFGVIAFSLAVVAEQRRRTHYFPARPIMPPDHYWFVLQWPNTICLGGQCHYSPVPQDFKIHGLWPVNATYQTVKNCVRRHNLAPTLQNNLQLQRRMTADWPNLYAQSTDSKNQTSFWNHEWEVHGSCQEKNASQYLKVALNIYSKYNLTYAFIDGGLTPGRAYSRYNVSKAVEKFMGRRILVMIRCDGRNRLKEVYICMGGRTVLPISCVGAEIRKRENCRGKILWPAKRR